MSRAWSLGKTDRCKLRALTPAAVKITAETKKNIFMQNVGPNSYSMNQTTKKSEPKWR